MNSYKFILKLLIELISKPKRKKDIIKTINKELKNNNNFI